MISTQQIKQKIDLIKQFLGQDCCVFFFEHEPENVTINCKKNQLIDLILFLKQDQGLRLDQLIDICGVDYLGKKEKRFQVVYHFLSMSLNFRVRVKVDLDEGEKCISLKDIYQNANWYEREVYDMFGVEFENNINKERLLTDYTFEGHPLLKDFPLSGYNEVAYDFEQKKVVYQPVNLTQEYRSFDFDMPWEEKLEKAKQAIDILQKTEEQINTSNNA